MSKLILDQDITFQDCQITFRKKKHFILNANELEIDDCHLFLNPYNSKILFTDDFISTWNRTIYRSYGVLNSDKLYQLREKYDNKILLPEEVLTC